MIKGWNDTDEKCSQCGNVTIKAKGINKQNLKKLFFSRPSLQDLMIFFLLVSVLFAFWAYNAETQHYKNIMESKEYMCVIDHQLAGYSEGILLNGTSIMMHNINDITTDYYGKERE